MSFGNLISKIGSIATSFIEKVKENKKEDNESIIQFGNKSSEPVNEASISEEFGILQDTFSEDIFNNRQIHRYAADVEEYKTEIHNMLLSANIPSNMKEDLLPLYENLTESNDEDDINSIKAEIAQIFANAEKDGINENLKGLQYDLELSAMRSNQASEMKALYEKLADADSQEAKYYIQTEIEEAQNRHGIEDTKTFINAYIHNSRLNNEQKDELSKIYNDLLNADNENDKDMIMATIEKYCIEQGINPKGEMISGLNYNVVQHEKYTVLAELFEKMGNTSSEKVRSQIWGEIELARTHFDNKMLPYESQMLVNDLGLDKETQTNILEYIERLEDASDEDDSARIIAEIDLKLQEAGIDTNSNEYITMQRITLNIQQNKELEPLYENLSKATDEDTIAEINAQINEIYQKYNPLFEELNY